VVRLGDIELPDPVYDRLRDRAESSGLTIAQQLARDLASLHEQERHERALAEAIGSERADLARSGVFLTEDLLREAKAWGRS
jgi:hypothetical protein